MRRQGVVERIMCDTQRSEVTLQSRLSCWRVATEVGNLKD